MVVTDEPGIYLTGTYGVRIEDTVLITKSGCITLTKSDKNYIIVDEQDITQIKRNSTRRKCLKDYIINFKS